MALAPVQTSGGNGSNVSSTVSSDGTETYGRPGSTSKPPAAQATGAAPAPPKEPVILHDDLSKPVPEGAKCKRLACKATYTGWDRSEKDEAPCVFHKGAPLFHEGSKGYTCCKRRVLEFDEFLKIEGCTEEKHHAFQEKPKDESEGGEIVKARTDFYQTFDYVHLSIFAKKVDKDSAKVDISSDAIELDLRMPATGTRTKERIELYGPVDPSGCEVKVLGTKVEVKLKKADETSWVALRKGEETGEIIQVGRPKPAQ